jgi:hypothetical protein
MVLKYVGINTRNWVDPTQDRNYWRALVNAALNLQVPYAMELVMHVLSLIERFIIADSSIFNKLLIYPVSEILTPT